MTEKASTQKTEIRCECCLHFQADQLDTGYCRLHSMYVLKTFDCQKFTQREKAKQGGDASRSTETIG